MKAKEFQKILTEAGLDFDAYGYEGFLFMIGIYCRTTAKANRMMDSNRQSALKYQKAADYIDKALEDYDFN